ncbi:hypothetical protein ACFPFP_17555 [Bradyrhizobium sp. GCM10023182]|uniref:Uncharacterized protein n=1 Tax=Bradyrhizobium zhengyangense TaxID=2911009 RepID=A0ABS9LP25_9BRAD|nr:hypothetical protein [Bradyrhizobium zhengyangense]MCG2668759.1 hypothetical protein [Bradyrhizobium zhengyangense]
MKNPKHWNCVDCGVNTAKGGPTEEFARRKVKRGVAKVWQADKTWEVYEVNPQVWKAARCRSVLCIGCIEQRIGRRLTPADFTDGELNQIVGTKRLSDRKGFRGKREFGFLNPMFG